MLSLQLLIAYPASHLAHLFSLANEDQSWSNESGTDIHEKSSRVYA